MRIFISILGLILIFTQLLKATERRFRNQPDELERYFISQFHYLKWSSGDDEEILKRLCVVNYKLVINDELHNTRNLNNGHMMNPICRWRIIWKGENDTIIFPVLDILETRTTDLLRCKCHFTYPSQVDESRKFGEQKFYLANIIYEETDPGYNPNNETETFFHLTEISGEDDTPPKYYKVTACWDVTNFY